MGGRTDPGLVMTAHVLPCAFMVFTKYSGKELARHRGTLTRLARGGEVPDDEIHDSIVEGLQGLGGLTMLGALLTAVFLWVSQRCACRKCRPCRSGGMVIFVEDAAQPLASVDVETGDLGLIGDGRRQWLSWSGVGDALVWSVGVVEVLVFAECVE
jgi:hypothetical protein